VTDGGRQNSATGTNSSSILARLIGQGRHDRARLHAFHWRESIRCTTPRRLVNLVQVKAQRWLHQEQVTSMPINYFIDPINICNLRCPLCPTGRGLLARPPGRLAVADLKRIIDEIAPYAYRIELYNWGEPLLHPDIYEMIEYVSQRRISVGLSSNLNRLDAQMARRLVESGLSQLVVSIDGATQETYAAYRRRGRLDTVLANLQLLLDTRNEFQSRKPFIVWRMLVGKHNEHEVAAVRRTAYQMGVDAFVASMLFIDTSDPDQIEQWLPTDPAYSPYDYEEGTPSNQWDCHELWESMVINWDGGVAPCCWLHDPQFDFANVSEQSVREIWNGPHYRSARRVLGKRKGKPGEVATICHRCRGQPSYMEY
jgi:radical SAM protein with 4Fe4S-binding SPASM domain